MKTVVVNLTESTKIEVTQDTQFVLNIPNFNADMSYQLNFIFNKPFVSCEILGIFKIAKDKTLNLTTITNHIAPHTSCMTKVKYVLESRAKTNYVGKILIQKSAYQTSSFLHTDALVVGEETSNISEPILQIEANDVKASHGSTTGRINPDHLYYLMSRALDYETAQNLIVQGFFESLISKIADVKIQKQIKQSLRSDELKKTLHYNECSASAHIIPSPPSVILSVSEGSSRRRRNAEFVPLKSGTRFLITTRNDGKTPSKNSNEYDKY